MYKRSFPKRQRPSGKSWQSNAERTCRSARIKTNIKLERVRFAPLKISQGSLVTLQKAVDLAKRDWRDELMWAGFGETLTAHAEWAAEILGQK